MTETQVDIDELLLHYHKFKLLRSRMAVANLKYRRTDNGKKHTKINQQKWLDSKKNDEEYRLQVNQSQRERYRKRMDAKKVLQGTLEEDIISNAEQF